MYTPPLTVSSLDVERIEELLAAERYKHMPGVEALKSELLRATVVEPHEIPPGVVTMNSTVRCRDEQTMEEHELTLVYPNSDTHRNPVSILAPVGSALLGMSVGQTISWQVPGGRQIRLHVLEVNFQPEASGHILR